MNEPVHILGTCLSLALFWGFWHYGWKTFILDATRQKLFSIRDELFDIARHREHGLTFESRVYTTFRISLNSNIRFAHRITSYHIWIAMLFGTLKGFTREMRDYKTEVEEEIDSLQNQELKQKLQALRMRVIQIRVMCMLLNSPIFLFTTFVASFGILIATVVRRGLLGSIRTLANVIKDEIKRKELEPSARAIQFQTEVMQEDEDLELCAA